MPIKNLSANDGVIHGCFIGDITADEMQHFVDYVHTYSRTHPRPIVALIDAREMLYVRAAARVVFARATSSSRYGYTALVAENFPAHQNASMLRLMAVDGHAAIFDSYEEAVTAVHHRVALFKQPTNEDDVSV